ncbi:hypothetical protein OUZ56_011710 [Daphnia magna]|uniref:Uncharacterized protein n=1 Tax=Daphnia magna TaxID=35525 RepID=A0ABQ9Z0Y3_9CRUS|nr:hypothetical protein OUZ56_011710 [Daphnia magna]
MAAAVNHMPSLLQSRTAFHSTVKLYNQQIYLTHHQLTTTNSSFSNSIVDYNPTVFTDCPLFTTRYTATNFNEQPATHYLLNRTVGSWLRSLLQFPSNHQLMFLTAPLTAFKHDSEAAGRLAALPFAATQTTTNSLYPACFFYLHPPDSHQFQRSIVYLVQHPLPTVLFLRIHLTATNYNEPKQATSSLLFTALLSVVHHPSQTALFFAPIRQPQIFKGSVGCVPFFNPPNNHQHMICSSSICCIPKFSDPAFYCVHQTATNYSGKMFNHRYKSHHHVTTTNALFSNSSIYCDPF